MFGAVPDIVATVARILPSAKRERDFAVALARKRLAIRHLSRHDQIHPTSLLTRVTRIFQKSVFTETTPAARAGDRAGFLLRGRVCGRAPRVLPCLQKKQRNTGDHSDAVSERPKRESVPAAARGMQSGNAPACEGGATNCRLQKMRGHCFAPVLYYENTYSDVCRRKRRGRSPDRAKRDPGISQAAMMRTS